MGWYEFRPYVSVGQRQANARKLVEKLKKQGRTITPVELGGRTIATTFWGKAWCEHLESYSDFANRLPRGRTYVRNGSVIDLQIAPGKITALVSGSEVYEVEVNVKPLAATRWGAIKKQCAGRVGSVLELLQGRLDKGVMEVITGREEGMFPAPREIELDCSCPDWADMCKHVAAVLYGVGARLDRQPELLFVLRRVDHLELIEAATGQALAAGAADRKTIAAGELGDVFGIELEQSAATAAGSATAPGGRGKGAQKSKDKGGRAGGDKRASKPAKAAKAAKAAKPAKPVKGAKSVKGQANAKGTATERVDQKRRGAARQPGR